MYIQNRSITINLHISLPAQGEERGALLRPGRGLGRRQRRGAAGVAARGGRAPGEPAELLRGHEAHAEIAVTKLKSLGNSPKIKHL